MISKVEVCGCIKLGDMLIEVMSGNIGIVFVMVVVICGYKMVLIMLEDLLVECCQSMVVYGVEIILMLVKGGMELVCDFVEQMQCEGKGVIFDQFGNFDNLIVYYEVMGLEIWCDIEGCVMYFVFVMGMMGMIMGMLCYLKEQNVVIEIVGVQLEDGLCILGICKWLEVYMLIIFDCSCVDCVENVSQVVVEMMVCWFVVVEGIFVGILLGGVCEVVMCIVCQVENVMIVFIVCDCGDCYLFMGVFLV